MNVLPQVFIWHTLTDRMCYHRCSRVSLCLVALWDHALVGSPFCGKWAGVMVISTDPRQARRWMQLSWTWWYNGKEYDTYDVAKMKAWQQGLWSVKTNLAMWMAEWHWPSLWEKGVSQLWQNQVWPCLSWCSVPLALHYHVPVDMPFMVSKLV